MREYLQTDHEYVSLVRDFVEDANASLQQAQVALRELEADPSGVEALFRSLHTIKGVAGILSLDAIGQLAHGGECLLFDPRARQEPPGPDVSALLEETLREIKRLTDELDSRTTAQMAGQTPSEAPPVQRLVLALQRLIANACRETGKQVELDLSTRQDELDSDLIDVLREPLVHLLRNCVDHGIEGPDERERLGKPVVGKITVAVSRQGDGVVIEIKDDGKGLDRGRILSCAIAGGWVEPSTALSDEQIDQLVFLPGFSTAKSVTSLSGRGVGMDAVKHSIEAFGGSVKIESQPGCGARFIIHLPGKRAGEPVALAAPSR